MNTADLIERVAAERGLAKDHARKIIDSALAAIAAGEPITIAASRKLSFTPAKALRDALNQTPTKNAAKAA
jgi:nucleoid DNA-binding protein